MMMIQLLDGDCGIYIIRDNKTKQERLVQSDWDYPSTASLFGWAPCKCGETDGTIDCEHKTASEMIQDAGQYLDNHIGKKVQSDYFDYFDCK